MSDLGAGTDRSRWCFTLLGELRVTHAGESLAPPPPRAHALLANLLLSPRRQPRERLVGLLFPDVSERSGRRRLSDVLWLLRDVLPGLPLNTASDWIEIPAPSRWLDVEAFRDKAASKDLFAWQEALALYGGDLLPGCYEDWLLVEREALHLEYVRLLFEAAESLFRFGRFHDALPLAERLVYEEPLDERALRLAMRLHGALGQRGAALASYERFVGTAADELGVEPAPATQALAHAIRTATPAAPSHSDTERAKPVSLVQRAQAAIHQGDRSAAKHWLRAAGRGPTGDRDAIRWLQADLALLCEDYERADGILQQCRPQRAGTLTRRAALALARRDRGAAYEAASQALIAAHQEDNEEELLQALLVMAEAQRRIGKSAQALATAERALHLARTLGCPSAQARALLIQGKTLFRQGRTREAIPVLHRAQSLAHEEGLERYLAEALHGLAYSRIDTGDYANVVPQLERALSIWRDLGLPRAEARTLQRLASVYDLLGRHQESMRVIERARRIYELAEDEFGVARCKYHLAANTLYRDEGLLDQGISLAEEAIEVFRRYDEPGWEASALGILGLALLVDGAYAAALEPLSEACAKHEALDEVAYLADSLAHQGLAHLGLGDPKKALNCTERALLALAQGVLDNDIASEVTFAHAMALEAAGRAEEAQAYLVRAYDNLLRHAAQLEDEAARRAFFSRDPMIRRLMKEARRRGIAPQPEGGVVTRWLPSKPGDGFVTTKAPQIPVTWTVDAGPSDTALKRSKGAMALRRSRLERILREAKRQGAHPTTDHLADALDVSPRTIKRDLAALREQDRIP